MHIHTVGAVVLAAGKGTRLGCTDIPKVMLEIGGKPIVAFTVEMLESLGLSSEQIVLVVGFQKEKVMEYFGDRVTYALQAEQQGTAHAAYTGMVLLPDTVQHVLVLGGDDSAFYTAPTIQSFLASHLSAGVTVSLLSAVLDDPDHLGRVVRHENGDIEIIEKEYITEAQATIKEISTGTFCFDRHWFEQMYPLMPPLRKLGEYALPTALAMARNLKKPYQVITLRDPHEWFGVNTPDQLEEARQKKAKHAGI
jgi:bifunctional UDP-N-acetylglucosamine pyrophosphorylase/glucosamine-1-phosphate N-acetyltransferase